MNISDLSEPYALNGVDRVPFIFGDDNDPKSRLNKVAEQRLKSIATGGMFRIEQKYKDAYDECMVSV